MSKMRNNHVFKGHKTLLGAKFVTYGELELSLRDDLYFESKNGFDWGHAGPAARQLAFSILYQLSNEEFAKENVINYTNDVIKNINSRDWILSATDVLKWIRENTTQDDIQEEKEPENILVLEPQKRKKRSKAKANIVKEICSELQITQKHLADILEVPEGTVSSWAVKNEIPRLGKKAIEFYIQSQKNKKIVDSYKSFVNLLQAS